MTLPPGFRFHPTDDELVGYYLKRKVDGQTIELEVIPEIELYKFDPWELPEKSFLPKRDLEWFFFCPRDKKYPNGSRTNRATASGYWKATGKDRKVFCESSVQGLRKTLVFYRGRAPGGERTDWVMHEYRLCEDLNQATPNFLGGFALCRIIKRNEQGMKIGDSMRESKGKRCLPFSDSDFGPRKNFSKILSSSEDQSPPAISIFEISNESTPLTYSVSASEANSQIFTTQTDQNGFWGSNYLCDAPENTPLEECFFSESLQPTQFPYSTESCPATSISPVSSYASLTEETYLVDELNMHGCFSPLASPLHRADIYCNNDDIALQGFEWEMSRYVNSQFNGTEAFKTVFSPMLCRQASKTEEASLWLQEDNSVVVM